MTDISVIILVGKELLHMRRCLEKLAPLEPRQVFVIESQPDDGTHGIAVETGKRLGWTVVEQDVESLELRAKSLEQEDSEFGIRNSELNVSESLGNGLRRTWYDVVDPQVIWALPASDVGANVPLVGKKRIKDCFKEFGVAVNAFDGVRAVFPAASAGKMLYQSGTDVSRVVSAFKVLFEGSRLAWREHEEKMAGHKYHFNVKSYSNYVNKFILDGTPYFIRFTLREIGCQFGVHASTISEVLLYQWQKDGARADSIPENPEDGHSAPFMVNKISYPPDSVKADNRRFIDSKLNAFFSLAKSTNQQTNKPTNDSLSSKLQAPSLTTVFRTWPGTHGPQVNWALDNCPIESKWVLRLDADEYLTPETIAELKETLVRLDSDSASKDVTLISMPLIQVWSGRVIKYGTGTIVLPRIFRFGVGRSDDRVMDEKIYVTEGREITLRHGFADDNLISIDEWTKKHLNYAEREAKAYFEGAKGGKKGLYYRLPPYFRALIYFCVRYFLRGGFLEGKEGFTWHFFQGLWYRCLVDYKIGQLKRRS